MVSYGIDGWGISGQYLHTGQVGSGLGSGRGLPAELMAPRVSWRLKRGWHLCGVISQFSIASGNWQGVKKVVWLVEVGELDGWLVG